MLCMPRHTPDEGKCGCACALDLKQRTFVRRLISYDDVGMKQNMVKLLKTKGRWSHTTAPM
jgi:hypothetical protein